MTQRNASFMSMELPTEHGDYFRDSMNTNRIFSYADTVAGSMESGSSNKGSAHQGTTYQGSTHNGGDDTTTRASVSDFTSTGKDAELAHQHKERERLNEAAVLANNTIESQHLEIEQLKAQQLQDIVERYEETSTAQQKVHAQEEATSRLQHEAEITKQEVGELFRDMKSMMQQMMEALANVTVSNNRSTESAHNSSPSEKRQDARSTPVKSCSQRTWILEIRQCNRTPWKRRPHPTSIKMRDEIQRHNTVAVGRHDTQATITNSSTTANNSDPH